MAAVLPGVGICAGADPDPLIPIAAPVSSLAAKHPPSSSPLNTKRLLFVIPDYQTVDSANYAAPLTPRQKWDLAYKDTVDPFNLASAVMTAAFSQVDNQTPKYGEGGVPYAKRFGAAVADGATQNFFSAGVLANLLHQDPRYFRMGPGFGSGVAKRTVYSVLQLVVARKDSGGLTFNSASMGGMVLGIAASNLYYPAASRSGAVMAGRLVTSVTGNVVGNLMSEFIPDIQKKFLECKLIQSKFIQAIFFHNKSASHD
jgi:hypothetical protein